jgi:arginine decarboxylase
MEIKMTPKKIFFTKGVGRHKEKLESFELALRDAGIEKYNLVKVSSILPPNCEVISKERGLEMLSPGQIIFCVLSEVSSNEPGRKIVAGIGLALPQDKNMYGYLSEHHAYTQDEKQAGSYAENLAASMLASTLGIDFDPDKAWDERRQEWKLSGKIVKTKNFTKAATVDKSGKWCTVIAVAVFVI